MLKLHLSHPDYDFAYLIRLKDCSVGLEPSGHVKREYYALLGFLQTLTILKNNDSAVLTGSSKFKTDLVKSETWFFGSRIHRFMELELVRFVRLVWTQGVIEQIFVRSRVHGI